MKKIATVALLLVFSVMLFSFLDVRIAKTEANTIVVPDDYDSIQEAVDNACEGDIVFVKSGTYYGSVFINKSLSLIGEDKTKTTIVGDWGLNGTVVLVRHDAVTIRDLTMKSTSNSGLSGRGVHLLHVRYCHVSNCNFGNNGISVWLYGASENTIEDNHMVDGTGTIPYSAGIKLQDSHYNSIIGNDITEYDYGFGIVLDASMGNNLTGNHVSNCYDGLWVRSSSNNSITSNSVIITRNIFLRTDDNVMLSSFGLRLHSSSNNIIASNTILDNSNGIQLTLSSYFNLVENNTISNSTYCGLELADDASHNTILGNKVVDNKHGLEIKFSSNNTLRNNDIADNVYNFWVNGTELRHFIQDFDASNMVNNKPVYYWVNKHDLFVPLDAGYVALVNCTNITITGLEISNNYDGLLLAYTMNSTITKSLIVNNYFGVKLYQSTFNSILESNLRQNYWAVWFYRSTDNSIAGNNITANNKYGMLLITSSNNRITANNIVNNRVGASFGNSSNNFVYQNNFINNTKHVEVTKIAVGYIPIPDGMHIFDNVYPSGGNYWDDYNGTDANHDGIGDTPYLVSEYRNNTDDYPLMAPITIFDAGLWEWTHYNVDAISNSTVSNFNFNPEEGALIRFNVDGETGTTGFCRVTIPKDMLNTEDNWVVLVDENAVTPTISEDADKTYLYFTYEHSTKTIEIIGTTAIPEFPSWTAVLFVLGMVAVVLVVYSRKLPKMPAN